MWVALIAGSGLYGRPDLLFFQSSIAVFQDVTGKACHCPTSSPSMSPQADGFLPTCRKERAVAIGVAIGSGYMYETTFEKEVYSDLYGERGCLMGGIRVFLPSPPSHPTSSERVLYAQRGCSWRNTRSSAKMGIRLLKVKTSRMVTGEVRPAG